MSIHSPGVPMGIETSIGWVSSLNSRFKGLSIKNMRNHTWRPRQETLMTFLIHNSSLLLLTIKHSKLFPINLNVNILQSHLNSNVQVRFVFFLSSKYQNMYPITSRETTDKLLTCYIFHFCSSIKNLFKKSTGQFIESQRRDQKWNISNVNDFNVFRAIFVLYV